MLFHTWTFAAFFLAFFPLYLLLKNTRLRSALLVVASYVFYGWWSPLYLLLILRCTVMDWAAGRLLGRLRGLAGRKAVLAAAVACDLGALGLFKYAGFVTAGLNAVLGWAGAGAVLPHPRWLLPVGISFYTFQSIGYLVDCWRGTVRPERSLLRYAAFVALFPQLVAGPIERAGNLLAQLRRPVRIRRTDLAEGLSLLLAGLFKKLALADYLGLYVDAVYAAPEGRAASALALGTLAFAWQIYFDFSGYTDMARGIARLMGLRLVRNFDRPYLADGLGDFWRRWHVSLSEWFRDYVYIPLGGNRRGTFNTYRNLVLTMLLCGLWHGAAWTFVVWGALHAAGRVLTRRLEVSVFWRQRVPLAARQGLTFAFVTFAWIFFRAESLSDAATIISRICTGAWTDPRFPLLAAGMVAAAWAYQYACQSRLGRVLELAPVRVAAAVALVLYLALVPGGAAQPFIYFQF